ncbi:hypothetical protein [uncultured Tateyamaria sp.]|uniref:hypothetical protein n=1 Tax=uncultured Tateyamaria sp. TaxID=455651 RepID=UPI0026259722|nr:hypothetical protein [uncultured Tateyamaria sp.]
MADLNSVSSLAGLRDRATLSVSSNQLLPLSPQFAAIRRIINIPASMLEWV